ncbi:MAG: Fatty acid hydroxylase protein [Thermodesulfobacteriota bacterium]|nr:Fatty acid hydroxylase protein [Thermodesulfobacteriota bacterium]
MIFPDANLLSSFVPHETAIRSGCFMVITVLESAAPRRPLIVNRPVRWFGNLSVQLVNGILPRLLFPILPVGMAALWAQEGWGLLNMVPMPPMVAILLSLLVFDLIIYAQHFLFHRINLFWRLHRMHHTDMDLDLTTALRFHPLGIVISLLIKMAAVAVFGPPAVAVFVFEILLNGMAMFNHGNYRIPARMDDRLRKIVVTPDMHLVHHSSLRQESNHNYGFNLSWWDRLFRTYQAEPAAGRERMTIGLSGFLDDRYARFGKMILNPFEKG